MTIAFEATLNPDQLAAVIHDGGPQLVLAGAGSGKTRVITYRIAWLVEERGVDPASITAVTFTNKAAGEMRGRAEELLRVYPLPAFVGTFHRFALRLLRAYGDRVGLGHDFAIVDAADQLALAKKALEAHGLSAQNFPPQAVLAQISSAKNRLLDAVAFERQADDFTSRRVAPVYRRYQDLLAEIGAVDFDDMIRLAVELLRGDERLRERVRRRTRHLMVDEFQDTNHAQLCLIRELAGEESLTAVGDEDQSIYRWRGAEIENILEFERHFPGAVIRKLERNYRSTQTILDAAGALVAHNERRRGKSLWTDAGAGENVRLYRARDDQDEARWVAATLAGLEGVVPLSEMAVLVRTNAQTRALEEEFLRRKTPYALIGSVRFYERAEVKDLISYLRLARNPHDVYSLQRIYNKPPRGVGQASMQALVNRAAERGKTPWQVLLDDDLGGFAVRSGNALLRLRDLIQGLADEAQSLPLPVLLRRVLEVTGYTGLYDEHDAEDRGRLENIQELVNAVQEFAESHGYGSEEEDLLTAFLDHAALVSAADAAAGDRISVMTLHAAKGLEFRVVAIPGLEEDVLPHFNAGELPEDLEEERRLLYVGMTRAKERLLLATAARRRRAGLYQDQRESRFLHELPSGLVEVEESLELRDRGGSTASIHAFFGRSGPPSSTSERRPSGRGARLPDLDAGPRLDPAIRRGARVRHPVLGKGQVLDVEGDGEDARLTVFFENGGKRKLIAKYAQLEVV